jgi:hypothetical protein
LQPVAGDPGSEQDQKKRSEQEARQVAHPLPVDDDADGAPRVDQRVVRATNLDARDDLRAGEDVVGLVA